MPQSLHYGKAELAAKDSIVLKEKVSQGLGQHDLVDGRPYLDTEKGRVEASERVVLTWREKESYEDAQRMYPYVKHLVVPDIAFQLGPYAPQPPETGSPVNIDIVLFLRDDKESVLAKQRDRNSLRKILETIEGGVGLKFTIVDWLDAMKYFETDNYFFSDASIKLLSMGRVVICDRLHAAILCYLTGVPFVYVDQVSGKISKTLGVAFESWEGCKDGEKAMWARAMNLTSALEQAVDFLGRYNL